MFDLKGPRQAISADGTNKPRLSDMEAALEQVRARQNQLGQGPDIDPRLLHEAYLFLNAAHFSKLREFLFDTTYRMRPPLQGDVQAAAMALAAYQGRCGLMDLLFALADQHTKQQEQDDG